MTLFVDADSARAVLAASPRWLQVSEMLEKEGLSIVALASLPVVDLDGCTDDELAQVVQWARAPEPSPLPPVLAAWVALARKAI